MSKKILLLKQKPENKILHRLWRIILFKKIFCLIKKNCTFIVFLIFCSASTCSFAAKSAAASAPTDSPDVVSAINAAAADIKALIIAAVDSFNNMMYQLDQSLPTALKANSQQANTTTQMNTDTTTNIDSQIGGILRQIPEAIITPSKMDDPNIAAEIQNRSNLTEQLTTDTPGSDTLYIDSSSDPEAEQAGVAKPQTLLDDYFNFQSLFSTSAYNDTQTLAAKNYLVYAAETYQNLIPNIDFTSLKTKLADKKTKAADLLKNIVTDPVYQKYQLDVRSIMALKSAAISNLSLLTTERTPVKDLGTNTGIPDNPQLAKGYASPLEVDEYIANHRLVDKKWFNQMQTASPAAVAREQAIILAEIESLLYKNHMDNERILATLSVSALAQQTDATVQAAIADDTQAVDSLIKAKIADADADAAAKAEAGSSQ